MMDHCFIVAGEKSGDEQASSVLHALKKNYPHAFFEGIGGPALEKEGMIPFLPFSSFQVMGASDVIGRFPKIWWDLRKILHHILESRPTLLLLVDYPMFNLALAKALKKRGYQGKIVQYICPKVWAWGKKRMIRMERDLDLLLSIFPFEVDLFAKTSLPCVYVGNPLLTKIRVHIDDAMWKQKHHIPNDARIRSLFPGSRQGEIERNFPPMLDAVSRSKEHHLHLVSCADTSLIPLLQKIYADSPLAKKQPPFFIPHAYRYEMMKESELAIAKSGTVNLELALQGTPSIVIYALTRLNRWVAQYLLRVNLPHYSLVNILLQKEAFPELIAGGCSAEQIFSTMEAFDREVCRHECKQLQELLVEKDTGTEAVKAIQAIL